MKQIFAVIFDLLIINIIKSKNIVKILNYSSQDHLYYSQLYLDSKQKKFFLDTTSSSISSYFSNVTYLSNCQKDEKCFINSTILINDTINNNKYEEKISIILNYDIEYKIKEDIFLKNEVDCIIGLNNGNNTIVEALYNLNIIDENLFSICLSEEKGYLGLGQILGIEKYLHLQQEINFINLLYSSDNLFELKVNYIKINSIKIETEFKSVLDTSKSNTFFPKSLYDQIITCLILNNNNLKQYSEHEFCSLIDMSEENAFYDNFPDIIINFENNIFIWKSKHYFSEYSTIEPNKIKLCISFKELNNDDDNGKIILGTDFMKDYEFVFDKTNQKIAFINTDCDKLFSNDDIEIINTYNLYETKSLILDNIEYNSNFKDISDNYLTSKNFENTEKIIDDNSEILTNDNLNNTIYNTFIINNETSDLLLTDSNTNYISEYSSNILVSSLNIETSVINEETIGYNISENNEMLQTTQIINELNKNIIGKNDIHTTEYTKNIDSTIIEKKDEENITQTSVLNIQTISIDEKKEELNESENKEIDIQENNSENETEEKSNSQIISQYHSQNKLYQLIGSFLKNKLIYFLVAFLGVVFSFVSIIFISCAIISCVKYIQRKRRDYMEQVDVELPKYSRGNNMSSFSDRDN